MRALCVLGIAAWLACGPASEIAARGDPADGLRDGVLLYLPLDGDAEPRFAAGARPEGAGLAFGRGRVGRAAASGVEIPGPGNFHPAAGTVSFWVRPDWTPGHAGFDGGRPMFRTDNFAVHYDAKRKVLFFMTGRTQPGQGYRWDYGTATTRINEWKPGAWHHVAATWDAALQQKSLFLDGERVASNTTDLIRDEPFFERQCLALGAPQAPGAFDELVIWNRPLEAEDVASLASAPEFVARQLLETLPRPQAGRSWPVEIGVCQFDSEHAPETIVAPGERFVARVPMANRGVAPWRGRVTFTLLDFREAPRGRQDADVSLGPGERRVLDVPFDAPECGAFKVAAELRDGDAVLGRDVASFAAWPRPEGTPDADSWFGYHIHSWSEGMVAQAARLGAAWNRNHDMLQATWWKHAQPEPGEFRWTHEFQLDRNRRHGIRVLGEFYATPSWAAAGSPRPNEDRPDSAVPDLEAFRRYVTATVGRYRDTIRHWEIWNEPEVSLFWQGTPGQFAALCRTAYEGAKEADPGCVILQSGYVLPSWHWREEAARAGALRYADTLSMHFYYRLGQTPDQLFATFKEAIDRIGDLARSHGPGHELPIWNSEGGSSDSSWLRGYEAPGLPPAAARAPIDARLAALRQVQSEAILQTLGVARSFYYFWHPPRADDYFGPNCIDVTGAPKPKLMARVAMASMLARTRHAGTVRLPDSGLWAAVYEKDSGPGCIVLWWGPDGRRLRADAAWPGEVVRRADLMGNDCPLDEVFEVADEPTYLHIHAPAAAVLAALNSARVTPRFPRP